MDLNKKTIVYFLFLFISNSILSQTNFSGKVLDNRHQPILYANICFKESNIGTITDKNGEFTLIITEEESILNDSLIFSHLNYKNKTIAYSDLNSNDSIVLEQDYYNLSEVAIYAQYAHNSYRLALSDSKEKWKPIILFFTASYCGPCKYYKNLFAADNKISRFLKENYTLIICDIQTKPGMKLKRLYGSGSGVPNFIVITPDERIIAKHSGGWWNDGMDDEACLNFLKQYSKIPEKLEGIKQIRQTNYDFSTNELRKRPIPTFDKNLKKTNWRVLLNLGLINVTNIMSSNDEYSSSKIGYDFGLYLYYNKKGSNFSFQQGLQFSSQGGRNSAVSKNFRMNYLEMPLRVNYQFYNKSFIMKGGFAPYVSYGLTAKNKIINERINFGSNPNELKRWDYGIMPGLTISPIGNMEIFTGYKIGLNNISNISKETMYNRGFYMRMTIKIFGSETYK
ncbi:MAG: outer membrane beta-barrel protein [Marinilabiliaceae bacterium]|nr:outer membrane beta-barrel protein [Marinilabiliaceae bacterium]